MHHVCVCVACVLCCCMWGEGGRERGPVVISSLFIICRVGEGKGEERGGGVPPVLGERGRALRRGRKADVMMVLVQVDLVGSVMSLATCVCGHEERGGGGEKDRLPLLTG